MKVGLGSIAATCLALLALAGDASGEAPSGQATGDKRLSGAFSDHYKAVWTAQRNQFGRGERLTINWPESRSHSGRGGHRGRGRGRGSCLWPSRCSHGEWHHRLCRTSYAYIEVDRYVPVWIYPEFVPLSVPVSAPGTTPINLVPQAAGEASATTTVPADTAPASPVVAVDAPFESVLARALTGRATARPAFALGEARLNAGDFDGAAGAFELAVADDPGDPAARMALALALLGKGEREEAAAVLREGVNALGDDVPAAGGGAVGTAFVQQLGGALTVLEGAVRAGRPDPDARLLLGYVYYLSGRTAEAADVLWSGFESGDRSRAATVLLLAAEDALRTAGLEAL
jgi:hypothetical protein